MRQSDIDRRLRRTVPRQCVADYGMHKDAKIPPVKIERKRVFSFAPVTGRLIVSASPNRYIDFTQR